MKSDRSLARSVAFPRVINIHDFRRLAKRRLPAVVFAYIDGGAEDEITLRENVAAFADVSFRPRNCVAVPSCDLRTTVLGETFDLPFLLAPVGFCRMFYPKGELHAARAANDAGTAYILSTFSGTRLEEVRGGAKGTLWFQLYVPGGREIAEATMARAKAAGYKVLVVTIDTPVSGMRERDFRYGVRRILQGDIWGSLPYAWQFVKRPRWVVDYFADGRPKVFPNVELPGKGAMPCGDVGILLASTIVTWEDLRWMREAWQGPVVVKGVHTGDDARRAMDAGAQAVVVSNHGGRQLDGVPASMRALPGVVDAVKGSMEVVMAGGIRRGGDVVRAICLGAKAVLVGRAYAWALGAAGGPGGARAIEILRTDVIRTMRVLGCPSIRDLDQSYLSANTRHDCR